ncbi:hypothetical protein NC652_019225 [Populus alba x Populus x berolinensis]|nr:hypothetical protein NC652_019225 [Populus alba x Populus x berolinensis]
MSSSSSFTTKQKPLPKDRIKFVSEIEDQIEEPRFCADQLTWPQELVFV